MNVIVACSSGCASSQVAGHGQRYVPGRVPVNTDLTCGRARVVVVWCAGTSALCAVQNVLGSAVICSLVRVAKQN